MGADLSTLDKHDVAAALTALGEAYAPYCEACLKNGIGGAEALDLDDEDLAELGVSSRLRRKALLKKLRRAKFASTMKHEGALAFWADYSDGKASMPWSQFVDFFAAEFMDGQPDMAAAQQQALKTAIDGEDGDGIITTREFDRWASAIDLGASWTPPFAAAAALTATAAAVPPAQPPQKPRAALDVGSTLADGRFCITAFIAEGGMGAVWKAYDKKFEEYCAIKIVKAPPGPERERAIMHMQNESVITRAVKHDFIMLVNDMFLTHQPAFMACEYIDGKTLQWYIEQKSPMLSTTAIVEIGVDVLTALAHVHERGIVHRDVKPLNIMLRRVDGAATCFQVKVLDFGIAQRFTVAAGGGAAGKTMTTHGGTGGTPDYMGPLALSGALDPRVDLWAAGVTLYQTALFKLPFKRGRGHLDALPPANVARIEPPQLRSAIEQALAQDHDEGFPTAAHFLEPLKKALQKTGLTTKFDEIKRDTREGFARVQLALSVIFETSLATRKLVRALVLGEVDCPRYAFLVPVEPKGGWKKTIWKGNWKKAWKKTKFWFHNLHSHQLRLVLACGHDFKPVVCGEDGKGYLIKKEKGWVKNLFRTFGPFLKLALFTARVMLMGSGAGVLALPFLPELALDEDMLGDDLEDHIKAEHLERQIRGIDSMVAAINTGMDGFKKEQNAELDGILSAPQGKHSMAAAAAMTASEPLQAWTAKSYRSLRAVIENQDASFALTGLVQAEAGGVSEWVAPQNKEVWEMHQEKALAQEAAELALVETRRHLAEVEEGKAAAEVIAARALRRAESKEAEKRTSLQLEQPETQQGRDSLTALHTVLTLTPKIHGKIEKLQAKGTDAASIEDALDLEPGTLAVLAAKAASGLGKARKTLEKANGDNDAHMLVLRAAQKEHAGARHAAKAERRRQEEEKAALAVVVAVLAEELDKLRTDVAQGEAALDAVLVAQQAEVEAGMAAQEAAVAKLPEAVQVEFRNRTRKAFADKTREALVAPEAALEAAQAALHVRATTQQAMIGKREAALTRAMEEAGTAEAEAEAAEAEVKYKFDRWGELSKKAAGLRAGLDRCETELAGAADLAAVAAAEEAVQFVELLPSLEAYIKETRRVTAAAAAAVAAAVAVLAAVEAQQTAAAAEAAAAASKETRRVAAAAAAAAAAAVAVSAAAKAQQTAAAAAAAAAASATDGAQVSTPEAVQRQNKLLRDGGWLQKPGSLLGRAAWKKRYMKVELVRDNAMVLAFYGSEGGARKGEFAMGGAADEVAREGAAYVRVHCGAKELRLFAPPGVVDDWAAVLRLSAVDVRSKLRGMDIHCFLCAEDGVFDEEGVVRWIATKGGTQPYVNPDGGDSGTKASMSTVAAGEPKHVVQHDHSGDVANCTDDKPDSWMAVDLGDNLLVPSHYALRADCKADGASKLRHWVLEGSRDGRVWVVLREHVDDRSCDQKMGVMAWPLEARVVDGRAFCHFRIRQAGKNSSGGDELACSGMELYGRLTNAAEQLGGAGAAGGQLAGINSGASASITEQVDDVEQAPTAATEHLYVPPTYGVNCAMRKAAGGGAPADAEETKEEEEKKEDDDDEDEDEDEDEEFYEAKEGDEEEKEPPSDDGATAQAQAQRRRSFNFSFFTRK
jgi:serine/threonine-protein kinase